VGAQASVLSGPVEDCRRRQPRAWDLGRQQASAGWHLFSTTPPLRPMLLANTGNGRATASPKAKGTCPLCESELIAKCGEHVTWHWAHKSKDCDSWSEPESEWHREWKNQFPAFMQEVVIGPHRADVQVPRGIVEFQRSSISSAEIRKRENFYGRMAWVVDASEFWLMSHDKYGETLPDGTARWLWARKSWLTAEKPVYFDRGEGTLLRVTGIEPDGYVHYSSTTKRAFVEQWTGLLNSERLLPLWTHPLYSYMKNPALNPRRPELGPNHAIWLQGAP
jgi:competence protein CoiA